MKKKMHEKGKKEKYNHNFMFICGHFHTSERFIFDVFILNFFFLSKMFVKYVRFVIFDDISM